MSCGGRNDDSGVLIESAGGESDGDDRKRNDGVECRGRVGCESDRNDRKRNNGVICWGRIGCESDRNDSIGIIVCLFCRSLVEDGRYRLRIRRSPSEDLIES